jgi:hypothetical protein
MAATLMPYLRPHKERKKPNRHVRIQGCQLLNATKMPAVGKKSIERTQHILGHQLHITMAVAHHHFP